MQFRQMGDSDFEVSAIGFGAWEMGGTYGSIDEKEAFAAVHRAIDLGVTLFDTARIYGFDPAANNFDLSKATGAGRSEELLGRALGERRKEVLVVTKGALSTRVGQKKGRDSSYQAVIMDCEASLRSLGTDYVDLYLIHWPDPETPFEEPMRALNDLIAAGKTRYVGVSNFSAAQLRECRALAPIITNQVGYNLFDRRWEREMFPTAKELGISMMAYGPLAHRLLTGSFTTDMTFEPTDWRSRGVIFGQALFQGENYQRNIAVVEQLKAVARSKGISLPQLALAWVLANEQISVALTGARKPSEIEDNVAALDITLSESERAGLETIMHDAAGQVEAIPA